LRIEGGEPSADGRGSAPPELAKQQAQAGSDAAPATPPPLGAQSTFIPLHRWGGGVKVLLRLLSHQKVTKRLFSAEICDKIEDGITSGKGAILWELRFRA
jgi:hypothetical protein